MYAPLLDLTLLCYATAAGAENGRFSYFCHGIEIGNRLRERENICSQLLVKAKHRSLSVCVFEKLQCEKVNTKQPNDEQIKKKFDTNIRKSKRKIGIHA